MAELCPFRALRCTDRASIPIQAETGENPALDRKLADWLSNQKKGDETLKQDTDPGLMIYEQEFTHLGQRKKVKGLLSLVKIEEETILLPHEEVSIQKEQEHFELLQKTGCQLRPVYCMYEDDERKTMSRVQLLSSGKPRFEWKENGTVHRIWLVNDILVIAAIKEDFLDRRLFLADGHSRYAAAQAIRQSGGSDYIFTFLADMEQEFTFLPSHCLIRNLESWNEAKFLADCEPFFQVIPRGTVDEIPTNLDALYRQGKKAFAFYSGGANWTLLILKDTELMGELLPDKSESFRQLDVSIFHSLVLEKLLAIPKDNENAISTDSIEEALTSVQNGEAQCAFFLNPARRKEICEISEVGEKMPPQSTSFFPVFPVAAAIYKSTEIDFIK
ncbi:MAG TPA: DUF1015 family protein [Clostridia bacterium]|nr:DUF1015 family protein [Clostridia bacterium]